MLRALVVTSALLVVFGSGAKVAEAQAGAKRYAVEIKYKANENWIRIGDYPTRAQAQERLVWCQLHLVLADARIVEFIPPSSTPRVRQNAPWLTIPRTFPIPQPLPKK